MEKQTSNDIKTTFFLRRSATFSAAKRCFLQMRCCLRGLRRSSAATSWDIPVKCTGSMHSGAILYDVMLHLFYFVKYCVILYYSMSYYNKLFFALYYILVLLHDILSCGKKNIVLYIYIFILYYIYIYIVYNIVLYCIILYYTVFYCNILFYIISDFILWYNVILYCGIFYWRTWSYYVGRWDYQSKF